MSKKKEPVQVPVDQPASKVGTKSLSTLVRTQVARLSRLIKQNAEFSTVAIILVGVAAIIFVMVDDVNVTKTNGHDAAAPTSSASQNAASNVETTTKEAAEKNNSPLEKTTDASAPVAEALVYNPSARPESAPKISAYNKSNAWYDRALTGLQPPHPASLRFLEFQGAWYTPFTRPGMTGPYDLRGFHRPSNVIPPAN